VTLYDCSVCWPCSCCAVWWFRDRAPAGWQQVDDRHGRLPIARRCSRVRQGAAFFVLADFCDFREHHFCQVHQGVEGRAVWGRVERSARITDWWTRFWRGASYRTTLEARLVVPKRTLFATFGNGSLDREHAAQRPGQSVARGKPHEEGTHCLGPQPSRSVAPLPSALADQSPLLARTATSGLREAVGDGRCRLRPEGHALWHCAIDPWPQDGGVWLAGP
jgi:hypothetical protein